MNIGTSTVNIGTGTVPPPHTDVGRGNGACPSVHASRPHEEASRVLRHNIKRETILQHNEAERWSPCFVNIGTGTGEHRDRHRSPLLRTWGGRTVLVPVHPRSQSRFTRRLSRFTCLLRQLAVAFEEAGYAVGLSEVGTGSGETVGTANGAVVVAVGAAQLCRHGERVVEVGQR